MAQAAAKKLAETGGQNAAAAARVGEKKPRIDSRRGTRKKSAGTSEPHK